MVVQHCIHANPYNDASSVMNLTVVTVQDMITCSVGGEEIIAPSLHFVSFTWSDLFSPFLAITSTSIAETLRLLLDEYVVNCTKRHRNNTFKNIPC